MMGDRLPEWAADLARCVNDRLMKDIVSDGRAHNVILSRGGTAKDNKEPSRGTGWVEPPSTSKWQAESGINLVDRLVDHQDRLDRAQLVRQLTEAALVQSSLAEAEAEAKKLDEDKDLPK
jgi:hypothetical protein